MNTADEKMTRPTFFGTVFVRKESASFNGIPSGAENKGQIQEHFRS
jgi:hypothetical protein